MVDSPTHSDHQSDTPSPSVSPSSQQQTKKRTRASKPKVRTGCITCKIRRVKCGEEKPACVRCMSTGRTCDGYDTDRHPHRNHVVVDPLDSAELAKSEFLKACQDNEALRSMRPLAPDIDHAQLLGRRITHRFPPTDTHACAFAAFWNRVSPEDQKHDPAVRHAIVALGSALPSASLPEGFTSESLEVFTIQHYNLSIARLQPHVRSSHPDSIRVTLMCCLAFIFLESLRYHHAAAVTHLINGLRILATLPPSAFEPPGISSDGDAMTMPDIINLFGRLEASACFFPNAIRPLVATVGLHSRLSSPPSADPSTHFHRDVLAYLHSPTSFPAHTLGVLLIREAALASTPLLTSPPSTLTFARTLAALHVRCAQLQLLTLSPTAHPQQYSHHHDLHRHILSLVSSLHAHERAAHPRTHTTTPFQHAILSDIHTAAPLFLLASQTAYAPALRNQAIHLLAETLTPILLPAEGEQSTEHALREVALRLEGVILANEGRATTSGDIPRALVGLGCLPWAWDALLGAGERESGEMDLDLDGNLDLGGEGEGEGE